MAKLSIPFDVPAFEIHQALQYGHHERAKRIIIERASQGYHSVEFSKAIVAFLEGKKKRRQPDVWENWVDIGRDYFEYKQVGRLPNGKRFNNKGAVAYLVETKKCKPGLIAAIIGNFKKGLV